MPNDAALGWRSHSGWAVLVAVSGTPEHPTVLNRRRVELLAPPLPRQPYHAAVDGRLGLSDAAILIRKVEATAAEAATAATVDAVAELAAGHRVTAVGLVGGGRKLPSELTQILGSHLLLHAAEGDLYEQAIAEAAARAGLPLTTTAAKTAIQAAAATLSITSDALAAGLVRAGRTIGAPWQKDHREAAAAALVALAL